MLKLVVTALALGVLVNSVAIANAKHRRTLDANGNGVVVSHKTGAKARVAKAHVAKFQGYIDELEENGAIIYDLGGIRRGRCSSGHMHPCGRAMDVCQLRRGVVSPRCRLPASDVVGVIAMKHGLFEGGQWCNHDYGHVQVGVSAPACHDRSTIMMAKAKHHRRYAKHRVRYARSYW